MSRVVSFGSVNVDHVGYLSQDRIAVLADAHGWFPDAGETVRVDAVPAAVRDDLTETFLGGKGANQAVAAAAAGADASLLGCVGEDEAEHAVVETLAERGVTVDGLERVDAPTGYAAIVVDETAENRIAIVAGANGRVTPAYARRHADRLRDADCLLLQNELPAAASLAALDELSAAGRRPTVVYDPAPADGAERVLAHDAVDVVTPNESEAAALAELLADFDGTVVRTLGARGVAVETVDDSFHVDSPTVDAVDTTGAGDVFAGYLAAALGDGAALRAAVERAAVAAALSTTAEGVQTAVPARTRVLDEIRD
ncbi:PfkB family carbohydrate kinase [Haloarchaeobius iranensis]|uniref:Ribokinase n=1 Tax=Haloarchaeobius iranensis TaxID=996166 RepID=A0A1G9X0N3_9EURY|nr:PfkB family carbohydrate kinase [Haloarchaeobius iranensis]SDM90258.1 ribokinase [Haloarchaeobius iranensis]